MVVIWWFVHDGDIAHCCRATLLKQPICSHCSSLIGSSVTIRVRFTFGLLTVIHDWHFSPLLVILPAIFDAGP